MDTVRGGGLLVTSWNSVSVACATTPSKMTFRMSNSSADR
jgi:hypothetical protein